MEKGIVRYIVRSCLGQIKVCGMYLCMSCMNREELAAQSIKYIFITCIDIHTYFFTSMYCAKFRKFSNSFPFPVRNISICCSICILPKSTGLSSNMRASKKYFTTNTKVAYQLILKFSSQQILTWVIQALSKICQQKHNALITSLQKISILPLAVIQQFPAPTSHIDCTNFL